VGGPPNNDGLCAAAVVADDGRVQCTTSVFGLDRP
jgi:hypothetical protein